MEAEVFDGLFQELYSMIPLVKKHFLQSQEVTKISPIPRTHFPLLFTLAHTGRASMGELSRRLGMSKPLTTAQVNFLVKEGLLERFDDPRDRRQIFMQLTEKGIKLTKDMDELLKVRVKMKFEVLGSEELEALAKAAKIFKAAFLKIDERFQ